MEFGLVTVKELNSIDFSLPKEPATNKLVLKPAKKKPQVWLGCAERGGKEWIGKIY